MRRIVFVIASFGDRATEAVFHGSPLRLTRRYPPDVVGVAIRKLDMLNAARALVDLRTPPGNRLESLRGDLTGLHSIRVNDQWRIVSRWVGSDVHEVRLIDYH
jgi:proteic killer suppression protein